MVSSLYYIFEVGVLCKVPFHFWLQQQHYYLPRFPVKSVLLCVGPYPWLVGFKKNVYTRDKKLPGYILYDQYAAAHLLYQKVHFSWWPFILWWLLKYSYTYYSCLPVTSNITPLPQGFKKAFHKNIVFEIPLKISFHNIAKREGFLVKVSFCRSKWNKCWEIQVFKNDIFWVF